MPTRNVNLTKEMDRFIAKSVKSGHFANASEVMRSALRMLAREEREYEEKLAALRTAIAEGDASAFMDGEEFFDDLSSYIDELARKKAEKVA
jgi:antitoxin ParD1/3/4